MFQQILVPLDGTAAAECAVGIAARLAHAAGGVVMLLRVIQPSWQPDTAITGWAELAADDIEVLDAAEYLAEVRQCDALADVASVSLIVVGSVVPAILKAAEDDHADLIVLCQHRRSRLGRWVHSGITGRVVKRADVPVLVLREQGNIPVWAKVARLGLRMGV